MIESLQLRVDPATAGSKLKLVGLASTHLNIDANRVKDVVIARRSIDARQRKVMVNLTLRVYIDEAAPEAPLLSPVAFEPVPDDAPHVIVVGAGPAGLFAALRLIRLGCRPIILERGRDVKSRRLDIAAISREGIVDPDSNYCFGEGGAGAYSDGKLYTRSTKRGPVEMVLNVLAQHGASTDILVDAHPHIGSDRLPAVIAAMRETIIRCGGEVHFYTRVNDIIIEENSCDGTRKVTGVLTADGRRFDGPVILATGHSARDVYEMLRSRGVTLEAKGIAVGVRLEHPQSLIDSIQYHCPPPSGGGRGKWLPAAEYSFLTRVDDRAVYSFCMCPGGVVVPAASAPGELVVNGMSPSNRGTRWANSAIVVEILPEDVKSEDGDDPLRMMRFQQSIEWRFFKDDESREPSDDTIIRDQSAPAQRMTDFVKGRLSRDLPPSSYAPGLRSARVDRLLPSEVAYRLQKGFVEFDRRRKGYLSHEAVVIGDETRTSSPVRVTRDPMSLASVGLEGLYPCGEGAGYAGGIVSAALDGDRVACAAAEACKIG